MEQDRPSVTGPHQLHSVKSPIRMGLAVVPVTFLGIFFVYPVYRIVDYTNLDIALQTVADRHTHAVLWFSFYQAALSTLLTLAIGLPTSYVITHFRFPGRQFLQGVLLVAFVLPSIVVASAFTAVLGAGGPLGSFHLVPSTYAILLAHVFFNIAVVVRVVGVKWSQLDPRPEEAAALLGAGSWQVWRRITFPRLRSSIGAAASLVFLFCFGSFGIVLVLGGIRRATLDVEIYRQTTQLLNLPVAGALVLLQIVIVLLVGLLRNKTEGDDFLDSPHVRDTVPPRIKDWRWVGAVMLLLTAIIGTPLVVLVLRSLKVGSTWTLDGYRALFHESSTISASPLSAITTSLTFAALATLFALTVGSSIAVVLSSGRHGHGRRSAVFDALVMLPLGVSSVAVGFGFLIALDEPPLDLRSSPFLIPLAQALVAIPFVVRVMLPVLRSIDSRLHDAAATLGGSRRQTWRAVDYPVIRSALHVAAGFAFAISLGEFGATIFIVRSESATMPVFIYRALQRPGGVNFTQAMAMSCVLMVLTFVSVRVLSGQRSRLGRI